MRCKEGANKRIIKWILIRIVEHNSSLTRWLLLYIYYKRLITFKVPIVKDLPSKKIFPSNLELDSEDDIPVKVQFPINCSLKAAVCGVWFRPLPLSYGFCNELLWQVSILRHLFYFIGCSCFLFLLGFSGLRNLGESGVVWVRGCLGQWTFGYVPRSTQYFFFDPMCVTIW